MTPLANPLTDTANRDLLTVNSFQGAGMQRRYFKPFILISDFCLLTPVLTAPPRQLQT